MKLLSKVAKGFLPPERLTLSQWADTYRKLSPESSAEPGQWRTSRTEYQRKMMNAISDPKMECVIIMSSSQVGKALDINTNIPTPFGWVKLSSIKLGDKVFDEQGRVANVVAVSPIMYDRPCWTVTFSDGSQLLADSNHYWTVDSDRYGKFKGRITISTEEIARTYKRGDRNVYAIPVTKPLNLSKRSLSIDPYVLGAWLGDGHRYSGQLTLNLQDSDEILSYINQVGHQVETKVKERNSLNVLIDPKPKNTGVCLRGHSLAEFGVNTNGTCQKCISQHYFWKKYKKEKPDPILESLPTFHKVLNKLGLISKSKQIVDKFIPDSYLRSGFEQRLSLLQGLMDTDGYIASNGRCEFVTVSPELAKNFGELLSTLGIKYRVTSKIPTVTYKGEKILGRTAYRFSFLVYDDLPIFRLTRKRLLQPNKNDGLRRVSETTRRRIVKVEATDSVPVRCIQVDSSSHLYLAGETMIPTHNSEIVNNAIAFYIHQDPCPILLIQPTVETAEDYSKDRIAPMIRDSPVLRELVSDSKSRDSGNSILHKRFPGGQLILGGSNSPAGLASRPIRVVLADEVDRYPASAGTEGDPVDLAVKRTTTFWNKKIILVSTPTIKGVSRIENAYNTSDKRRYYVSCPHCTHAQHLIWAQVKWEKGSETDAWYECIECRGKITNAHKNELIQGGIWKAEAEFKGVAGFHINELYSPWRTFGDVVTSFLKSKNSAEQLKVWVNTSLGETFDDQAGETLEWQTLMARAEPYKPCTVPEGGKLLTAGVDVQGDRLSISIWAWGKGEEAWLVYAIELYGDPTLTQVWQELDTLISSSFVQGDTQLKITAIAIDSGFKPQEVYRFIRESSKPDQARIAVKGLSTANKSILARPTYQEVTYGGRTIKKGIRLWGVGTDTAKALLYSRLRLKTPGEGYIHTYIGLDEEFYQQLTAEKLVTRYVKGYPKREWVKMRSRNEAIDTLIYAYAAALAAGMARMDWDKAGADEG